MSALWWHTALGGAAIAAAAPSSPTAVPPAPPPARAAPGAPPVAKTPPFAHMLGENGTAVGRAYPVCRLRPQAGPVVLACEGHVGEVGAVGLFTYDRAQVVMRVEVVFAEEPCVERATRHARALIAEVGGRATPAPPQRGEAGRWQVRGPRIAGEVRVLGGQGAWRAVASFTNPTFTPAKL